MTLRERCRISISRGTSCADVANRLGLKPDTVRNWSRQGSWKSRKNATSNATSNATPTAAWKQSLHHESSHLVATGESTAACGAKVPEGTPWHPSTGLRQCTRCMSKTSNFLTTGSAK